MTAVGQAAPPAPPEPTAGRTAGFVSRLLALVIDSAILIVAGVIAAAAAGMVANLFAKLSVSSTLGVLVAAATGVAGICVYFVICWWLAGQTVGMRILALRVIGPGDRPPGFKRSVIRLIGAIPLFAGYLIALGPKRLAFHDRLARTRVIYTI
jgi:uncharacterized RDD family membrane protein YckC